MMKLTRDFYAPKTFSAKIENDLCVVYVMDIDGRKPTAMGFGGKRSKPDFYYSFPTIAARDAYVADYIEKQHAVDGARKARAAAKKSEGGHTLTVGAILTASWGYDQTNVDFYEVTKVVGKAFVEIRPIAQACVEAVAGSDKVVAQAGHYTGEPMRKIADKNNSVRIASYARAYPWSGKPKHQTAFGYGH